MTDNWQSNGWCTTKCESSAYAVILGKSCWCSDYAPGEDQHDTSDCSDNCPGYPSEKCGNVDKKLYIYIKGVGGVEPSGTKGSSKPTSSKVSPIPNAVSQFPLPSGRGQPSVPFPRLIGLSDPRVIPFFLSCCVLSFPFFLSCCILSFPFFVLLCFELSFLCLVMF